MRQVLMVATSYPSTDADWQGRFIYDMAESLARLEGIDLRLWAPPGKLPLRVESALSNDHAAWLTELLRLGGIAHLLRKQPFKGLFLGCALLRRLRQVYRGFLCSGPGAIAHVNWLQNALPLMGVQIPALITVLGSDLALLRLPGMIPLVRCMLAGRRAMLAPNAVWMEPILRHHFGDLVEIRPIPFGVHDRWFAVERSTEAPASGDWIVVSRITKAKLGYLLKWGDGVFGGKRNLHLLGPSQEDIKLPAWVKNYGPTNPEALARDWFPRAAGLVTLSTHDEGRPQVMIEAMAAGLPVIASDLAAHRDLVRNGKTGYLVDDADSLAMAFEQLDDPQLNFSAGQNARKWVTETVGTWDDCARRYLNAYDDLLGRS